MNSQGRNLYLFILSSTDLTQFMTEHIKLIDNDIFRFFALYGSLRQMLVDRISVALPLKWIPTNL